MGVCFVVAWSGVGPSFVVFMNHSTCWQGEAPGRICGEVLPREAFSAGAPRGHLPEGFPREAEGENGARPEPNFTRFTS